MSKLPVKLSFMFALSILLIAVGCSKNAAKDPVVPEGTSPAVEVAALPTMKSDPVTLNILYPDNGSSAAAFMDTYGQHVQKKYPNVSFQWMNTSAMPLESYVAADVDIDIFTYTGGLAGKLHQLDYLEDITDYIKRHQIDLSRIHGVTLEYLQDSSGGQITALPIWLAKFVLYYNKELFNRFGEVHPRNGMTWDETYELSRKMTRVDQGVQYYGLSFRAIGEVLLQNPFGLKAYDTDRKQLSFGDDRWRQLFANFSRFYEVDGNAIGAAMFAQEQRVAMHTSRSNYGFNAASANLPPVGQWDVVTFPQMASKPGIGGGIDPYYFYLSKMSKQKEEAFMVMKYFISDEYQQLRARQGAIPSVKLSNIREQYGKDVPHFSTVDITAFIAEDFAPLVVHVDPELISVNLGSFVNEALQAVLKREKDANTALREAEEKAKQALLTARTQ